MFPISNSLILSLLAFMWMLFLSIWIIVVNTCMAVFFFKKWLHCLFFEKVIFLYQLHWLIPYLLRSEYRFCIWNTLYSYVCVIFTTHVFFVCFCRLIILYFVHWLTFTSFDLYVVSVYLNHCSEYAIDCFTRSDLFLWIWNNFYFISSSLFQSLIIQIYMLFLFT